MQYLKSFGKKKKIVGRGRSNTGGRGTKGQGARKSGLVRPGFEGGQTVTFRRFSKVGFFHPKKEFRLINLQELENSSKIVNEQLLDFSKEKKPVKILGNGNLTKKINIKAHAFSANAERKIQLADGKISKVDYSNKHDRKKE